MCIKKGLKNWIPSVENSLVNVLFVLMCIGLRHWFCQFHLKFIAA